jgi:hypothetical protein
VVAQHNLPLFPGLLRSDFLEAELECREMELDNEKRIDSEAKLKLTQTT